jgi:hypothetical protein
LPADDELIKQGVKDFKYQWEHIALVNKELWSRPCTGTDVRGRYRLIRPEGDSSDSEEEEDGSSDQADESRAKKRKKVKAHNPDEHTCQFCGKYFEYGSANIGRHQRESCSFLHTGKKPARAQKPNKKKEKPKRKTAAKAPAKKERKTLHEIEKIVAKRPEGRTGSSYLVRWKGDWPEHEQHSWIDAVSLSRTANDLVKEFNASQNKARR